MMLVIDVGNTRMKWGRWQTGRLEPLGSQRHHGSSNWQALFDACFGGQAAPGLVAVSNVAGVDAREALSRWAAEHWPATRVVFARSEAVCCGVRNAYGDPGQLGVDRWMALLGAHHTLVPPLWVVDCGTALTLDLLADGGRHCGGLIMPGVALMQEAVAARAAGIAQWSGGAVVPAAERGQLGRSTGEGLTLGSMHALAAAVDGLPEAAIPHVGRRASVALTGGDARVVRDWIRVDAVEAPHLVLQGLVVAVGHDSHPGR